MLNPPIIIGDYQLNVNSNTLLHGSEVSRLENKQVSLLLFLIAHAGKTINKTALIDHVWSERVVVDDVLSVAISQLRKAFSDNARSPTFIKTIPGHGYQFIFPVSKKSIARAKQSISTPFNAKDEAFGLLPLIVGLRKVVLPVLLAIVIASIYLIQPFKELRSSIIGDKKNLTFAVLPFENYSNNKSLDYYADSLTEMLISEFSINSQFSVISRTSVMGFKNKQISVPEIAKKLHANLILEGAILSTIDGAEVSLQLINTNTDHHLWAMRFPLERNENELLHIARMALTAITNEVPQGKTFEALLPYVVQSEKMQQKYNQVLGLLQTGNVLQIREAMTLLEALIREDNSFSLAYVTLAQVKRRLLANQPQKLFNASQEIKGLLTKALILDPSSSSAHLQLASAYFFIDWDFSAAEKHFKQALKINRNNVEAHNQYSQLLLALGRFEQALQHIQSVRDLDPLAYSVPTAAWIYTMQRRFNEAWRETDKLLALFPDSITYHRSAQGILEYMGREQNSFEHLKYMLMLSGYSSEEIGLVNTLFNNGQMKAVYHWLAFEKKESKNIGQYSPPYSWARYAVKAGDKDAALNWLEACYQQRRTELLWIAVDPKFDALHQEPRFHSLLKKLGLVLPK